MKKVVFLVDMNAFYITCETSRNDALAGIPAAVAGDPLKRCGIILAANYEARARGVKTAMVLHEALKLCPGLTLVRPDHHFYQQKSREVMELLSRYSPVMEQNSIDEAWLDMTGTQGLFGSPAAAAKRIMDEIKNELSLWCSIGIAENKFLSKMAAEMKKPLGITQLWQQDIPTKLWPLAINKMYGVGPKTADKLNRLGIKTIGELARCNVKLIGKTLGKNGHEIMMRANGVDPSPVEALTGDDLKSISRSTTLPEDISGIDQARLVLMELADDVAMTAREKNKKGHTVHITLKYADFSLITRQTGIPATNSTKEIREAGCGLLGRTWNSARPVSLIVIGLSGFEEDDSFSQLSLFEPQEINVNNEKSVRVHEAMDKIRKKHGSGLITFATLVKK